MKAVERTSEQNRRNTQVSPAARQKAPPDPPSRESAAESPTTGISGALRLLTTIASPIAVATGLMFYFGWVRTKIQAERLGYDSSLLDLSIQDYVLKSVNVLSVPLIALLLIALMLHTVHHRFVEPAVHRSERTARYALPVLTYSWLLWSPLGIFLAFAAAGLRGFILPGVLTLTTLCVLYASALRRPLDKPPNPTPARALLLMILAFTVFWDTERVARTMGDAYAQQIAARPADLVAMTVYSTKKLDLTTPGITETKINEPDSLYSYRYDGLRVLQRSGDRYFLISDRWDLDHRRVILLRETDSTRLEFSR